MPDGPVRYPVPIGGTPLLRVPALEGLRACPACGSRTRRAPDGVQQGPRHRSRPRGRAPARGGTITTASTGNAAVSTAFGAAAAGLRAVIFVSTDCQPEKLALMTQAGAWVVQVPEATRQPWTSRGRPPARSAGSTGTPARTRSPSRRRRRWRSRCGSSSTPGPGRDGRPGRRRPHVVALDKGFARDSSAVASRAAAAPGRRAGRALPATGPGLARAAAEPAELIPPPRSPTASRWSARRSGTPSWTPCAAAAEEWWR